MRPNPCAYISGDNHGYFKNSLYEVNKIGPERLNDIYNVHIDLDQLLVNANYQDMSDSFQSGEKRELPTRISIFANAFNSFFKTNNLAFKKVDTNFRVIFEKGGKEFSSKDFSSGESNIYYMAGKILQNSLLLGNLIIIDEPETGLHPN
jgi:predicted ATPase